MQKSCNDPLYDFPPKCNIIPSVVYHGEDYREQGKAVKGAALCWTENKCPHIGISEVMCKLDVQIKNRNVICRSHACQILKKFK